MYGLFVSTQNSHVTWDGQDQLVQHLVLTPTEQSRPNPLDVAAMGGNAGNTI